MTFKLGDKIKKVISSTNSNDRQTAINDFNKALEADYIDDTGDNDKRTKTLEQYNKGNIEDTSRWKTGTDDTIKNMENIESFEKNGALRYSNIYFGDVLSKRMKNNDYESSNVFKNYIPIASDVEYYIKLFTLHSKRIIDLIKSNGYYGLVDAAIQATLYLYNSERGRGTIPNPSCFYSNPNLPTIPLGVQLIPFALDILGNPEWLKSQTGMIGELLSSNTSTEERANILHEPPTFVLSKKAKEDAKKATEQSFAEKLGSKVASALGIDVNNTHNTKLDSATKSLIKANIEGNKSFKYSNEKNIFQHQQVPNKNVKPQNISSNTQFQGNPGGFGLCHNGYENIPYSLLEEAIMPVVIYDERPYTSFTDIFGKSMDKGLVLFFKPWLSSDQNFRNNIKINYDAKGFGYGRTQDTYIYKNVNYGIYDLTFKIVAQNISEVDIIDAKIEMLRQMTLPHYNSDGSLKSFPVIRLTIGNILYDYDDYKQIKSSTNILYIKKGLPIRIESVETNYKTSEGFDIENQTSIVKEVKIGFEPIYQTSRGYIEGFGYRLTSHSRILQGDFASVK